MPENHGWVISTTAGHSHEVDFLVGADGANSSVRASLVGKYRSSDLVIALGYYLPGVYHPNTAVAAFQEFGFPGYIWSFPRADHSSVGIGCRLTAADSTVLRKRLHAFMSDYYPDAREDRRFFAARIPCLSRQTLINQHVCGPNWASVGDAAGFVDAITSEGIYFALRSAELLAGAISSNAPMSYENLLAPAILAEIFLLRPHGEIGFMLDSSSAMRSRDGPFRQWPIAGRYGVLWIP